MLVDSHCHLNYKGLRENVDAVIERARAAGVGTMLGISTRASEWAEVVALADAHPDIWATVGIHPHEADEHPDVDADRLINAAAHPRVIGIGETGLDYFYDHSDRDRQRASFRAHIAAARATGLPLIVHTRDAEADTVEILREEAAKGPFPALIHCFSGTPELAEKMTDLGFYISLSGIVTFKKAEGVRGAAASVSPDRLLVETDAPYLAPVPHRGKRNEPAFVVHTAAAAAALAGLSADALADRTTENFFRLFSKVPKLLAGSGAATA